MANSPEIILMVKVTAPLMSQDARGKLAEVLDFAKQHGRNIVTKHRRPKQPRTPAQRATRHVLPWLASQWANLTADEQATWANTELDKTISPYHRYLRYNVRRLTNLPGVSTLPAHSDWFPTRIYPPTPAGYVCSWTNEVITPHSLAFTRARDIAYSWQNWGIVYFLRRPEKLYPTYDSIIAIETVDTVQHQEIRIGPIPAGLQKIHFARFTTTGLTTAYYNTINVTILP